MISHSEKKAHDQLEYPKTIEEVLQYTQDEMDRVERVIDENLHSDVILIPQVGKYVIRSGGKRIRPMLTVLSSQLCGYHGPGHIVMAAVIELIHTATLLHDDVIDHAALRRGERSVNSLWSNETSILVGDFFFTRAFSMMVELRSFFILEFMSKTCRRLAEGEILELARSGDTNISEEDYIAIIRDKTAVLISAACRLGAILGEATEWEEHLSTYGMNLGMAFQMVDDLLDYEAEEAQLGKTIGKDLQEGKITLPMIRALHGCSDSERKRIVEAIRSRAEDASSLPEIREIIRKYDGLEYTHSLANRYVETAKMSLESMPTGPDKTALLALADFVATRRN
jgi:octaprenyl-diphosphate synthase